MIPSAPPTAHDQRMLARESRLDDRERNDMYQLGVAHGREDATSQRRRAPRRPVRARRWGSHHLIGGALAGAVLALHPILIVGVVAVYITATLHGEGRRR